MLIVPPAWKLATIVVGTLTAVVVLTVVPGQLTGRRSLSDALQSERTWPTATRSRFAMVTTRHQVTSNQERWGQNAPRTAPGSGEAQA
jgi:hypothetical protein